MSAKKKKQAPSRKQGNPRRKQNRHLPAVLKLFLEIISVFATLFGVWAAYIGYIAPKLSVDAAGSVRPDDPMGTTLELTNEGYLSIYDVTPVCQLQSVGNEEFKVHDVATTSAEYPAQELSAGHKMTLPCTNSAVLTGDVPADLRASIIVEIEFRPSFLPWHRHEHFPVEATRTSDGRWLWRSLPR